MIVVCDPICVGGSHEKVNSGFIWGLRLAYPDEPLRLYADRTHIEAIRGILLHDGVSVDRIEYRPFSVAQRLFPLRILAYRRRLGRLLDEAWRAGTNRIFFLSFNPEILYVLKTLKGLPRFTGFKFTFVLHAAFESVADDLPLPPVLRLPRTSIPGPSRVTQVRKMLFSAPGEIPSRVIRSLAARVRLPRLPLPRRLAEFFSVKHVMEWRHSDDIRYIALSPHVARNASRYIDTQLLNVFTVALPTVFAPARDAPVNEYPKFAMFGYGDSLVLHNVAYKLAEKVPHGRYEIRVIGMDSRGTGELSNVTCPSGGRWMAREEMEHEARDIDAFLILYDRTRYRLSCSNAIFEALSYMKPVIHFENDCIEQFSTEEAPIGFRCDDLDAFVGRLADIVENYEANRATFQTFRGSILRLREEYSIARSVPALRASFDWPPSS